MKRLGELSTGATLTIALLLAAPQSVAAQEPAGDEVPALLDALRDGDDYARAHAAEMLGHIGDPRAVAPLAELLHDEDETLRRWALEGLSNFPTEAMNELVAALRSQEPNLRGDADVREGILRTIATLDDPRAAAAATEAVHDEQPKVRALALFTIQFRDREALRDPAIAETIFSALEDDDARVRYASASLLGSYAALDAGYDPVRVADALMARLDDSDADVRRAAVESLGRGRHAQAVETLLPLLDADNLQLAVASALSEIGDARAIEPLRRLLSDRPDPQVIRALGALSDGESVGRLIVLLYKGNEDQQYASAEALGKIKDPRAVDPLIASLEGPEQVMRAAAQALGELRDPRAIEPLLQLCRDNPGGPNAFFGLHDQRPSASDHPAAWPLVHMGLAAIEPLADALDDESETVREVAAFALRNINSQGDPPVDAEDMQPAVEPLARALVDYDLYHPAVRDYAASTLGSLGDKRAVPALLQLIQSDRVVDTRDSYLAYNAASYLSRIKDPETVPPLIELLGDDRPAVRAVAARALGYLRDERAAAPLRAVLGDESSEVRTEVAQALGRLQVADAVGALIDMLADVPAVRRAAAESLGRIGDSRAADGLAARADDEDFPVRVAAGIALVRLDDDRGPLILARALADDDPDHREHAAVEITHASPGAERLVPVLIDALDDPSIRVRLYIALALGRAGGEAAVDPLLARLDDRENLQSTLQGLAATKSPRAYAAILEHLDDEVDAYRVTSAYELGASGNPDYIEPLTVRLSDPAPQVRIAIINALLALNAASALPQLEPLLNDKDPQVALYAARAVKRLTRPASP